MAFFFRAQIANDFTLLYGDRYDGVITISILEHWYNVFRGQAFPFDTFAFFPQPATLGYNDGYLLQGLLYAPLRALGADPFLAGELVSVLLRALCFAASYGAARRIFSLGRGWTVLAAILITISDNMQMQALHAQLFGVGFAPVLALLLAQCATAMAAGHSRALLAWGVASALFLAAWLMTGFYMAWFFLFFILIALAAWLAQAEPARRQLVLRRMKRERWALLGIAACALLFAAPFLALYLPKAIETGQHSYAEAFANTLSLWDLPNSGPGNLLFGGVETWLRGLAGLPTPVWSEQMTGLPPLLLALFAGAQIWLWSPKRKHHLLLRVLSAATLTVWLLTLHIGAFSLWAAVYRLIPGAGAIRVVSRYQLFLTLPVVAITLCWLAQARLTLPLRLVLCGLLLVGEINTAPPLALDRPHELARLRAVPSPPSRCRAFAATAARGETLAGAFVDGVYSHNVDAMLIAETIRLPTINGFATFVPPQWNLNNPAQHDYPARVRAYAKAHNITGLCGLDLRTLRWSGP